MMRQSPRDYAGIGAHQPAYHGGGEALGQAVPPGGAPGVNVAAGANSDSYVNESISMSVLV